MWQFDYPWLFLLLPLPWAAWRYLPIYQEARRAVRTPFFRAISQAVGVSPQQSGVQQARRQLLLNLLVWVLLICALARPVWVEPPLQQTRPVRDLVAALQEHLGADTPVSEIMSESIIYCFEDDDIREAADMMKREQIRRLAVLNDSKRLVGIITLGDIARADEQRLAGEIELQVAQPA